MGIFPRTRGNDTQKNARSGSLPLLKFTVFSEAIFMGEMRRKRDEFLSSCQGLT